MASVTANVAGIVFVIPHDEVEAVINGATALGGSGGLVTTALAAAGVTAPAALVTAAISAYFGAQAWLIRNVDKGNGIYLTLPWIAIWFGQWWLIIPTTRPPDPGPVGGGRWSDRDDGLLNTEDGADSISWNISRGSLDPQIVTFRLEIYPATTGWDKAINMPDGLGSSWDIVARGRGGSAENSLWADQVNNSQVLTFRKPKFLGIWFDVLSLGDLAGLRPGDLATFRWMRD
jgi:hypothetical protein